ncbi:MAG: cobalt ECF transporter T component CbiQ [Syntrophobacterales bacterium]|nr:cobalt ECF transporter T component CbiQ [Syntrophobacterales bacterium]
MSLIREPFSEGDSLIHRLDPRGKVLVAGTFAVLVAVAASPRTAAAGLGLALLWLALAKLPPRRVAARLLVVNGFVVFLWLVLPLTYPGEVLWRWGWLAATREGLAAAGLITLKSNAILLGLIALAATVPIVDLGQALHRLRLPDKLCHLLLFTYRYLYVFEEEYQRLVTAMKIRGFRPRTDLHTYRSYAYLAAMLLVRSYDRSERVYQAMLCRGFRGRFYSLKEFSWQRRDRIFFTLSGLGLLGVAGVEWLLPLAARRLGAW